MPLDPVCGIELDEEIAVSLNHNGKSYFFCCEGCKGIFVRKPRKYAKNKSN
jgi:YHS domain-containing protein